jgi:NADPH:quinone reductase-like Zn-dependent oxidoreductase
MEAYRIDRFGSVDGIVLRSSEDPRPGLKEVLMRVRASSLNYRDLMVLKGGGRGPTKIGVVPLSDGAGEVAGIGEGVTRVRIGDIRTPRTSVSATARAIGSPFAASGAARKIAQSSRISSTVRLGSLTRSCHAWIVSACYRR